MIYNILIFEDNDGLRKSLELLLNDEAQFNVVATYAHCDDILKHLKSLKVDLIIMDIDMPGIGGLAGVKLVKQYYFDKKVIMHTVFDDDTRIFECICAGADGYLLKNIAPMQLVKSIEDVMDGGSAMSPFVAERIFNFFRQQALPKKEFNLTPREKEILTLLVKGNSYKMIASTCFITLDTVKRHLQNVYHKLHVNCGTEAVYKALSLKIVSID